MSTLVVVVVDEERSWVRLSEPSVVIDHGLVRNEAIEQALGLEEKLTPGHRFEIIDWPQRIEQSKRWVHPRSWAKHISPAQHMRIKR